MLVGICSHTAQIGHVCLCSKCQMHACFFISEIIDKMFACQSYVKTILSFVFLRQIGCETGA